MSLFRQRQQVRKHSSQKKSFNRRLRLEGLENKYLLAGDVFVTVDAGNLMIQGDGSSNLLVMEGTVNAGEYLLTGNDTTLNYLGSSSVNPILITGVTGDIHVDLGDNDDIGVFADSFGFFNAAIPGNFTYIGGVNRDAIELSNVDVTGDVLYDLRGTTLLQSDSADFVIGTLYGDLTILSDDTLLSTTVSGAEITGDFVIEGNSAAHSIGFTNMTIGDDVVWDLGDGGGGAGIGNITVGDDFRLKDGAGEVSIDAFGFDIGDDLVVDLGAGDDFFFILDEGLPNTVGDDVYFSGRAGNDEIEITSLNVDDKFRVNMGAGDDTFLMFDSTVGRSILGVTGQGDNDLFGMVNVQAGRSMTVLGKGTNEIFIHDSSASHYITVLTSNGDDIVELFNTSAHSALISTKGGIDMVTIGQGTELEYLFTFLGEGNDTLTLDGVTVNRFAFFHGGSGEDAIIGLEDEANNINFAIDWSFEDFGMV